MENEKKGGFFEYLDRQKKTIGKTSESGVMYNSLAVLIRTFKFRKIGICIGLC